MTSNDVYADADLGVHLANPINCRTTQHGRLRSSSVSIPPQIIDAANRASCAKAKATGGYTPVVTHGLKEARSSAARAWPAMMPRVRCYESTHDAGISAAPVHAPVHAESRSRGYRRDAA
jgi:hypothetical protein